AGLEQQVGFARAIVLNRKRASEGDARSLAIDRLRALAFDLFRAVDVEDANQPVVADADMLSVQHEPVAAVEHRRRTGRRRWWAVWNGRSEREGHREQQGCEQGHG